MGGKSVQMWEPEDFYLGHVFGRELEVVRTGRGCLLRGR